MPRVVTYVKMLAGGAALCIGGPALVMYVMPTEEELFKKYNPDLQKRSLANRGQRANDFDEFVQGLKQHAKSDKNLWVAMQEAENSRKKR